MDARFAPNNVAWEPPPVKDLGVHRWVGLVSFALSDETVRTAVETGQLSLQDEAVLRTRVYCLDCFAKADQLDSLCPGRKLGA